MNQIQRLWEDILKIAFRIGHFKTKPIVNHPERRTKTLFAEKDMAAMFFKGHFDTLAFL